MKNGTSSAAILESTTFSAYQCAVFAEVESGTGHAVVLAYAGSGKTTTIVEALRRVPRGLTIIMVAFNTAIKNELAKRAPAGVEVKTVHSHGFSAVRRAFGAVRVDNYKSSAIFEALYGAEDEDSDAACKIAGIAKDTLAAASEAIKLAKIGSITIDTLEDVIRTMSAPGYKKALEALDAIVDNFGVSMRDPNEEEHETEEDVRAGVVVKALVILARSMQVTAVIDFSDMCWLPIVLNLRVWAFDRVFVDETQDLSPCQIKLLHKFVKKGGRVLAVGDERQSIYQFRGADKDAIPGLVRSLDAKTLPLSITYRCPRAIVKLANLEVPQLEVAPNAIEGEIIADGTRNKLIATAEPGDMVISRTNAPLIGICLKLLVRGCRAAIQGRNVGEGLVKLIERSRAKTVEALEAWIEVWAVKEMARLAKKKRDATEAEDMKECVLALCRDVESVKEVVARAENLFSDEEGPKVLLGTTHKLKGLEADRVWMLEGTYRRKNGGEEANLWYVAVTRAKRTLVLTALPKAKSEEV